MQCLELQEFIHKQKKDSINTAIQRIKCVLSGKDPKWVCTLSFAEYFRSQKSLCTPSGCVYLSHSSASRPVQNCLYSRQKKRLGLQKLRFCIAFGAQKRSCNVSRRLILQSQDVRVSEPLCSAKLRFASQRAEGLCRAKLCFTKPKGCAKLCKYMQGGRTIEKGLCSTAQLCNIENLNKGAYDDFFCAFVQDKLVLIHSNKFVLNECVTQIWALLESRDSKYLGFTNPLLCKKLAQEYKTLYSIKNSISLHEDIKDCRQGFSLAGFQICQLFKKRESFPICLVQRAGEIQSNPSTLCLSIPFTILGEGRADEGLCYQNQVVHRTRGPLETRTPCGDGGTRCFYKDRRIRSTPFVIQILGLCKAKLGAPKAVQNEVLLYKAKGFVRSGTKPKVLSTYAPAMRQANIKSEYSRNTDPLYASASLKSQRDAQSFASISKASYNSTKCIGYYLGKVTPSTQSQKFLSDEIKSILQQNTSTSTERIIVQCRPIIKQWINYFKNSIGIEDVVKTPKLRQKKLPLLEKIMWKEKRKIKIWISRHVYT